jgi:hypothetical protein
MENRTKKFSHYTIIGFIILLSINILSIIIPENPIGIVRRISGLLNWFVFIPIFLITTFFSVWVLIDYLKHKFKLPIKYFLKILPFLVYFILYVIGFIYAVFKPFL